MKRKGILLIGPYPDGQFQHIGGATILFKNLVESLIDQKVNFDFITIKKYQGFGSDFLNYLYVVACAVFKIPCHHTLFINVNRRGLLYMTPVLFLYARLFKVRIILRMFGENSIEILNSANFPLDKVLHSVFKNSKLLFFETKMQVDYFKKLNPSTYWFPNCRIYPLRFIKKAYSKKFVFISQIKVNKGILIILDVFRELGPDYNLEIYGPILDSELMFIKNLDCYNGILPFDNVFDVLGTKDVLLLPSFHPGEGYPGIIIEAYSMSVPVIATQWKSIPEIVKNGVSGILIEPNSSEALKKGILMIDNDLYERLNIGAFEMSKNFQSETVHKNILEIIQKQMES